MASPLSCSAALTTTLALIDQFSTSLETSSSTPLHDTESTKSPLPLLSAAASALKSQVAKLSLLTLTAPFTSSAIAANLSSLIDSVLPSLVTATLLIKPRDYTSTFPLEAATLARTALRDLKALILLAQKRSQDGKPKSEVPENDKRTITEATGRVWEHCDELVSFSNAGLSGFVVKKATQWLELMKDAVQELQEWDPEEDDDDGLFDSGLDDHVIGAAPEKEKTNTDSAMIKSGVKDEALKVLTRIPQSIHVVVKQRLGKMPSTKNLSSSQRSSIDSTLKLVRQISECIDECAEDMYMGDLEGCLKKAGQARQITIEVVESVLEPWGKLNGEGGSNEDAKEDRYVRRALEWVRQVDPGPTSTGGRQMKT